MRVGAALSAGLRCGAMAEERRPVLLGLRDAPMAGPCREAPGWATNKLGGSAVRPGREGSGEGGLCPEPELWGGTAAARRSPRGRPPAVRVVSACRTRCPPCARPSPAAGRAALPWRTWCRCTARCGACPATASPTFSPAPARDAGGSPAGEQGAGCAVLAARKYPPGQPALLLQRPCLVFFPCGTLKLEGAALPVLADSGKGGTRLQSKAGTTSKPLSWCLPVSSTALRRISNKKSS